MLAWFDATIEVRMSGCGGSKCDRTLGCGGFSGGDGAMVAVARTTWLLDEVVDKTVAFITVVAAAATNAKGR